jgi:glycine/D-amino acid oxidase-like deaminating enzyme
MLPIEQSCYWIASSTYEYETPLIGSHRAEIAIVGGGLTGLWTAVFLRDLEPDIDIVLVEQGMIGYGGSGRNAGILDITLDHSHSLAISHFGFEEARKLSNLGIQNVREMISFLQSQNIDCDLEQTGRLFVALTQAQVEEGKESVEIAERLGLTGWRWLNADETRAEVASPLYLASVSVPGAAILNPFKLVQGLKTYLKSKNVRIFERSTAKSLEQQTVHTDQGTLSASKIIVALDAYSHHLLPEVKSRFIPLYDYILVSDPLTPDQQKALGWRNRQAITDGRAFFNYYRLTADQRLLFGTSEAMYYPPNRVGPELDHSTRHYEALHDSFLKHFPQLENLQFPYMWGGPIASTTRLTPFFGTTGNGHVHYALGYTGHGLGSTRVAGKVLAGMALGRETDLFQLKMVKQKPFPYPPEPLRSLAVQAVTRSLRRTDRGEPPNLLLRILNWMKIGFSS